MIACKTKHNSIWSKALLMPLTLWDFVLVLNLKTTLQMASGLLYDHQILLPSMLVLLLTFTLGSKYLLPAKKVNF